MSRVWFITGSSRGLGRTIVTTLLESGETVVATARQPETLADLKAKYGESVLTLALDVRDSDQARKAVQTTLEAYGRIDVLVNNAGYGNLAALEEASEAEFRDQIETNFMGVVNVTRAVLPVLRRQRAGHIIQVSSVGGRTATPGLSAYQAAKWAVGGFSEVLSREVRHLGIRVTVLEPGGMPTDWAGSSMRMTEPGEDYRESVGGMVDLLRHIESLPAYGSDLRKVAEVIRRLVEEPAPPMRLLIGSDAYGLATQADAQRLAEAQQWQALSCSTDLATPDELVLESIRRLKR